MKRPLVALMALAAALAGSGQSCFRVVQEGSSDGIEGGAVWCADGNGPWRTAADGRVCIPVPCDSVRIEVPGYQTTWASIAEAEALGHVGIGYAMSTLLKEVVIEHWPRKRDRHALAAVGTLDSTMISGFERSSLRSAAQWVPGVQWDERGHGGSARLSIRGSTLRSPYGVRGVKVYWGPFPLTLADGSTPLEILDPLLVGSLDITRSVGSPMYGSAPSGLLLGGAPFRNASGSDASVEATGGSFGYYRLGALARSNKGGTALVTGIVHQRNDGYRQQESSARDQAFIASSFVFRKSVTRVFLTWQRASWDLPGSLDQETAASDPRAARDYSVLIDAHLEKEQLTGGLANELRLGEHLTLRCGVHGQMIDKTNPYGTSAQNCGYKEETIRAVGARFAVSGDRLLGLPTAWDIGAEALGERDHLRELDYVDGIRGAIKVNGDTRVANLNAFATTTTRLGESTTLHVGAGSERTNYTHDDHIRPATNSRTTSPSLLPYAGIEQRVKGGYRFHARYAESLSRVTVWELLGGEGSFNAGLRGERVREWEIGASTIATDAPVHGDLNLFHRSVFDVLTQRAIGNDGPVIFENQGRAVIAGGELLVTGVMHRTQRQQVDVLGSLAITATDLEQRDPLSGERIGDIDIPGVPLASAGAIIRSTGILVRDLGIEIGTRFIGSMSTGDGTTGDEHVEHARVSYVFRAGSGSFNLFVHCGNLLDRRYSGWIATNDPGGRYYNPAPARGFFFGARLTFNSSGAREAD